MHEALAVLRSHPARRLRLAWLVQTLMIIIIHLFMTSCLAKAAGYLQMSGMTDTLLLRSASGSMQRAFVQKLNPPTPSTFIDEMMAHTLGAF